MSNSQRKIPAIFLQGEGFGGGHKQRIKHLSYSLDNYLYEFTHYPVDSFSKFLETIKKLNNDNKIVILDLAHSIICDKFNHSIAKNYFQNLHPIIFDGVNDQTSISRYFDLGKCSGIVPYACSEERLKIKNTIAAGESYFLFDLESTFNSKNKKKSEDRILITFGHSDPIKLTDFALSMISKIINDKNKFKYYFSTGFMFSNEYKKKLITYSSDSFKCINADIKSVLPTLGGAITASGHSKYEFALFDIPQLIIHINNEQKEANIPFEEFSGIKSFMKEEFNEELINYFQKNLGDFKPSKDFLRRIKKAIIEKPTLSIIENIIIKNLNL